MLNKGIINQAYFEQVLRRIFPEESISSNARKDSSVINPDSGHYFELDIWIPKFNLSFEFQDDYHYATTWYAHIPLDSVKGTDASKKNEANKRGADLIHVPCWWDGTQESLIDTIAFVRPDLLSILLASLDSTIIMNNEILQGNPQKVVQKETDPRIPILAKRAIPLNPSVNQFYVSSVPDIGELMYASFHPSLTTDIQLNYIWWIGEKYDGIRVCWNPDRKILYTRFGNALNLAHKFVEWMACSLDGEAWFGRGCFPETQRLLQTQGSPDCEFMRLIAFDTPQNGDEPFEPRYKTLLAAYEYDHAFVIAAMRVLSSSAQCVAHFMSRALAQRAEGLILRAPNSVYVHGRSTLLLKLKAGRRDQEALVVKQYEDGSYLLQMDDGTQFRANLQNDMELVALDLVEDQHEDHDYEISTKFPTQDHIKKGDIVTFSFDSFTSTTPSYPVNPKILRKRTDVTSVNNTTQITYKSDTKSKQKMQLMCENYAESLGLDPRSPETWYEPPKGFMELEATKSLIMPAYKTLYSAAMMDLFPDIGFQRHLFSSNRSSLWADVRSRRDFFCNLAKYLKFDPLITQNWYTVSEKQILHFRSATSILSYYNGSFARALVHSFPELKFDPNMFPKFPDKLSYTISNQKALLLDFARKRGFDPLVLKNWRTEEIELSPKVHKLVQTHRSIGKLLTYLFPEVKDHRKFSEKDYKSFFCQYAAEKGFDPKNAHNWYTAIEDLKTNPVALRISKFYNKDITQALQSVFPDIRLEKTKFRSSAKIPSHFWEDANNLRNLLQKFGQEHGFDPLLAHSWYTVSATDLSKTKEGRSMLSHYDGSLLAVLRRVFPDSTFDPSKFQTAPKNHWISAENRRKLFEKFALSRGFDPLVARKWYDVNLEDFYSVPKCVSVLNYYNKSFGRALLHLFPEIGLRESKIPKRHSIPQNRSVRFVKNPN